MTSQPPPTQTVEEARAAVVVAIRAHYGDYVVGLRFEDLEAAIRREERERHGHGDLDGVTWVPTHAIDLDRIQRESGHPATQVAGAHGYAHGMSDLRRDLRALWDAGDMDGLGQALALSYGVPSGALAEYRGGSDA